MENKKYSKYNTIDKEEKKAVIQVLESGELSGFVAGANENFYGGKWVKKLEESFCKYYKINHAIALNSATSGLYAMLMAMDLEPGDEVITSPYTMHATASSILQCFAIPIFADIESETYGLDPKSVEKNINKKTKGILAVNIFGHPAKLLELRKIAKKNNIWLLEDNSQSPSAKIDGNKFTGTIGKAGVFSFNRHKTIQSGEGGVVITNDHKIAKKIALIRNHGETVISDWKIKNIQNTMGQNLRMTEMEAAVAYYQFKKLESFNSKRIKLAERLSSKLKDVKCISTPSVRFNCSHVYYFYVMKFNSKVAKISKKNFVKAINKEGFYLRDGYIKPIYLEPYLSKKIVFGKKGYPFILNKRMKNYNYSEGLCPNCEKLNTDEILITNLIYPPLTNKDMDKFANCIKKIIYYAEEIENQEL